jgi:hypothetical protein
LLINQRKEENMSKHSPRILVDCVERKKAWFLALMFERQIVTLKNWEENLREWFSSREKKNEVLMRSLGSYNMVYKQNYQQTTNY